MIDMLQNDFVEQMLLKIDEGPTEAEIDNTFWTFVSHLTMLKLDLKWDIKAWRLSNRIE